MNLILEADHITKKYKDFTLDQVSLSCPQGSIMGLIGPNGAGKTTFLRSVLNLLPLDSGSIRIFGKSYCKLTTAQKEDIGAVFDENCLPELLSPKELCKVFQNIYRNWNSPIFSQYLDRLEIPQKTKVKEMSKGNKMKLNLAVALSHNPRLLILDEITGYLDPMMREEIQKLFLEFVQDERNAILFSSHIVTDLEKIADYITFLNHGKLIFSLEKDALLYDCRIGRCKESKFSSLDKKEILASRKNNGTVDFIFRRQNTHLTETNDLIIEEPSIEELMLILAKEDRL